MDPISDMIIRLKNAALAGREVVSMPQSSLKAAIAEKLKGRGFVTEVTPRGKKAAKTLEIILARTSDGSFRLTDVKRLSKPGKRLYVGVQGIETVRGGTGFVVLSTPRGIMFGDEAKREKVGGELLFEIW